MLETHMALFDNFPVADLSFSLSYMVDEHGRKWGLMKSGSYRTFSFRDLVIENPVGNGSAAVIRRDELDEVGPFDEPLPASSDCDMWFRIVRLRPHNFVCIPKLLTCYRRRDGQTTGNWSRMRKSYELVMDNIRCYDTQIVRDVEDISRCNKYRYQSYIAYESGELAKAFELLRESMDASLQTFLLDARSWLLSSAIVSRALLPAKIHLALYRWCATVRMLLFKCKRHLQHDSDLPQYS